jgi:hypothetical protein
VGPGQRAGGSRAVPCRGRTQARARVWLEVEDDPDRRAPPVSEREKGRRELARARAVGPGGREAK